MSSFEKWWNSVAVKDYKPEFKWHAEQGWKAAIKNMEAQKTIHQQTQPAISGLCASCCRGCEFNGSRQGRTSCSDYVGFAHKQQAGA